MQVNKQQLELDMEQQTGSRLGKEYIMAMYCHPCLFNLYAEYIMWNARLDEAQTGIKIAIRVVSSAYLRLLIFLPAIFDSSLCFIQSGLSHDILCI